MAIANYEKDYNNETKGSKISFVTATINEDVTISTAGTNIKLNLSNIVSNNSEFELSEDGGIICPYAGKISVTISVMMSQRTGYVGLTLFKNSNSVLDYYVPARKSRIWLF